MAKSQVSGDFANVILAQLSHERLADLRQHLQKIELEVKKVIYEPNRLIDYAYFVETGMISVVSVMNDGRLPSAGNKERSLPLFRPDGRLRVLDER